jgi:hypothetical protein
MRRAGWDTVDSALAASWAVPVAITAGLAFFGLAIPAAVAGVVGIACGGWSIYRKRNKTITDLEKPSAESYLYQAKKILSPRELVDRICVERQQYLPLL